MEIPYLERPYLYWDGSTTRFASQPHHRLDSQMKIIAHGIWLLKGKLGWHLNQYLCSDLTRLWWLDNVTCGSALLTVQDTDSKIHGAKVVLPGAARTQVCPMLPTRTLLSGDTCITSQGHSSYSEHTCPMKTITLIFHSAIVAISNRVLCHPTHARYCHCDVISADDTDQVSHLFI